MRSLRMARACYLTRSAMKYCLCCLFALLAAPAALAQAPRPLPPVPDSLRRMMQREGTPEQRMIALQRIANAYAVRLDTTGTLAYGRALGALARQQHDVRREGNALSTQSQAYYSIKLLPQALRLSLQALPLCSGLRKAATQRQLGLIYTSLHQTSQDAFSQQRVKYASLQWQCTRAGSERTSLAWASGAHMSE